MSHSQIKNEIKYNFIDYKQPVQWIQNDFRTSTYLGNRYYRQNDAIIPSTHSTTSPCYTLAQKQIQYESEQSSQFTPKLNFNRTSKANLYMCCKKPDFVKASQHRIFQNPPKPIRNCSGNSKDYAPRPQRDERFLILNHVSSSRQPLEYADVDSEGTYRYDSTNTVTYKQAKDLPVPGCSKDNITVWNYTRKPMCMPLNLPKYNLIPNRQTSRRQKIMKSENQHSFIVPVPKKFKNVIY